MSPNVNLNFYLHYRWKEIVKYINPTTLNPTHALITIMVHIGHLINLVLRCCYCYVISMSIDIDVAITKLETHHGHYKQFLLVL
jgi:hypothetical protein